MISTRPNPGPTVGSDKGGSDGGTDSGLGLGQLLLALDRTMVTLVEAPRGLEDLSGALGGLGRRRYDVRLGLAGGRSRFR